MPESVHTRPPQMESVERERCVAPSDHAQVSSLRSAALLCEIKPDKYTHTVYQEWAVQGVPGTRRLVFDVGAYTPTQLLRRAR
eukprot:3357486-Rhodomonas_salina.3